MTTYLDWKDGLHIVHSNASGDTLREARVTISLLNGTSKTLPYDMVVTAFSAGYSGVWEKYVPGYKQLSSEQKNKFLDALDTWTYDAEDGYYEDDYDDF